MPPSGLVWGKSMGSAPPDLGSDSGVDRLCDLGKPVMSLSFDFFIKKERPKQEKEGGGGREEYIKKGIKW